MAMRPPYLPVEVDAAMMAFPASVVGTMMPAEDAIPDEFRMGGDTKWNDYVSDQFFRGVEDVEFDPKDGIDPEKAWRHVSCVLRSYEPKHQHKEAAAAYLLSLWFEDVRWKAKK